MYKKHSKPEFEVIEIDDANAKFFAASITFSGFISVPNYSSSSEWMLDNPGTTWVGNATGPYSTHMDDGGTVDFN